MRSFLVFLFLSSPLLAAEPQAHRDLSYAEPKNERQTLDVYAPAEGSDHSVVLWLHGGGWRAGDKSAVQKKPEAFVEMGFVFVSTNYRFVPNVTVKEMTGDIAKAIRWIHDHAKDYGGDPDTIYVMGHSAGAHLAALVCTDDRYLKAEGVSLSIIKGCVPIDTAAYDVPQKILSLSAARPGLAAESPFGDAASQKDVSPALHIAKGKSIPPFLILHVSDRPDSRSQSKMFASALGGVGISAEVVPAEGKTHATINSELGLPRDKATQAVWRFLTQAEEMKRLQGTWTMESFLEDGKANAFAELMKPVFRMTIEGNSISSVYASSAEASEPVRIKVDPSLSPKTIDFLHTKPEPHTEFAIYQLDEGKLKLCSAALGKDRPTEFSSQPGSGQSLSTWKRIEVVNTLD